MKELTHFNEEGRARMVNVGGKETTQRSATARGSVFLNPDTFRAIRDGNIKKGDVLSVAQIGGIMGAKRTSDLIPMCHPIAISGADISFNMNEEAYTVEIEATVSCTGVTGVEMEALTAVSLSTLTVYDMCKAIQKDIRIGNIRLVKKSGGKSGDYNAE